MKKVTKSVRFKMDVKAEAIGCLAEPSRRLSKLGEIGRQREPLKG